MSEETKSFTSDVGVLRKALAVASSATERKNCVPVLGMVLFQCFGAKVVICGTNLDMEIKAHVEAEGDDDWSFIINPRVLGSILVDVPSTAKITFQRSGDMMTISTDGITAKSRLLFTPDEWPNFVMGDIFGQEVTIGEAQLREALVAVMPCISTEETRYYLNGIYLHELGEGLISVATNGHVLGKFTSGAAWPLPNAIWPRHTIGHLIRMMDAKGNGELRILADKSDGAKFHIEAQNWSVSFKTIDGTYPAYNRVIPEFEAKATITISASAVRRLPRFGDHSSEAVAIDTAASAMTMRNASQEFEVTVPVQAKGESLCIGFNARYLRMFAAQSQVMRFDLNSPSDPARVLDDDPRLLRVVMPMRV